MSKSPDEIKKGLECCMDYQNCTEEEGPQCPYCDVKRCMEALLADALALIQQLESDKQQLEGMLTHMNQLRDAAAGRALKMEERVRQLEAERDAAVADLTEMAELVPDGVCKWCDQTECESMCMMHATERPGFKWRGVQKEDSDA